MKIGKYLCSGYIIILLGIFNKSLCKTSLSTCQLKNPFKVQDDYADFTGICFKNEILNSTNSHCQHLCNQLESKYDLPSDKLDNKIDLLSTTLVVITIINIILAFVLLNKNTFKLTNEIQVKQLENETEEIESENESIPDEIKSKLTKKEVIKKCRNLENQVQELENEIVKLKKDKMDLIQIIDDQNKKAEVNDVRKNENLENMKRKNLKRKINTNKDKLDNETSIDDVDGELQKTKQDLKSIKKELELKEKIIYDKNAQIEMINDHADSLSGEINNLNDQQKKSLIDLKSKDSEIEKLRDDIESKIIEIKKLEQKNEELANKLKYNKENSQSESDFESKCKSLEKKYRKQLESKDEEIEKLNNDIEKASRNNKKNSQSESDFESKCKSLEKMHKKQLELKDEEIEKLKDEIEKVSRNNKKNTLSRSESDRSFSEDPKKSIKSFLNEINKITNNEFDCLDDCISLIKKLSNNNDRKGRRDYDQDENFGRAMGPKLLELENEELYEKNCDLESRNKILEKKYKKQLKLKEDEIEELQEELESAKAKKPQDNKSKIQLKELNEKIEEMEGDIESRTQEIKSKDKKIKEIENKCKDSEAHVQELDKEINKLKNDKTELTKTINNQNKEMETIIKLKDEEIKKKQQGMEVMKEKIEKGIQEIHELKATNAQHVVDLDELRAVLKGEKEKYGNLNAISNDQQKKITAYEKKIKTIEDEMHALKVARFKNPDNNIGNINPNNNLRDSVAVKNKWYPNWWDKHTVPDHNIQQDNRPIRESKPDIPKIPNRNTMRPDVLLACPNCHTMYSPAELENHVNQCIENQ